MANQSLAVGAVLAAVRGAGGSPAVREHSWTAMGGRARVVTVGAALAAGMHAENRVAELEKRWSRFVPTSEVSRLNAASGAPCAVSRDTIALVTAMRDAWVETDHDFDPTVLPDLLQLGYTTSQIDSSRVTTLDAVARSGGNLERMTITDDTVTLPVGMTLDPGGIGKGLAADLVAAELLDAGAAGVLVDLGGDIRVAGLAPDGVAWRIDVEDPFDSRLTRRTVRIPNGGIATSSQRKRRFRTAGAADAHHLVDPHTGRSAVTSMQTVTVLAATAARAECLTKPGFLRPLHDYLAWLPTRGAAGLTIDADGREFTTDNWEDYS